jgi:hypothetical protein
VRLTVTYQGRTSEPYPLTIAASGFGFYAATGVSTAPGERVTLTGTGRGEGNLEVFAGGRRAPVRRVDEENCCKGVERFEVEIPRDAAPDYEFDFGIASFGRQESGERPFPPVPPANTCALFTATINLRQMLSQARSPGAWTSMAKPLAGNRHLDAGAAITIAGERGTRAIGQDARRQDYYSAMLGGAAPFVRTPSTPLFLRAGSTRCRRRVAKISGRSR